MLPHTYNLKDRERLRFHLFVYRRHWSEVRLRKTGYIKGQIEKLPPISNFAKHIILKMHEEYFKDKVSMKDEKLNWIAYSQESTVIIENLTKDLQHESQSDYEKFHREEKKQFADAYSTDEEDEYETKG